MKVIKQNRKHNIFKHNPTFTCAIIVNDYDSIRRLEDVAIKLGLTSTGINRTYQRIIGPYNYETYTRNFYLGLRDESVLTMMLLSIGAVNENS